MLKMLSLSAILIALSSGALRAQQQEAVLQKLEVPAGGFDLVIATPKPGAAAFDYREDADPLVVYTPDNKLAFAYDDEARRLLRGAPLQGCSLQAGGQAVTIYAVEKREQRASK